MRNPNGFGSVAKMTGNRRRPWRVRITVGWEINEATGREKQISKTIGYFATKKEAMLALAEYNQNPYDLTNRDITFKKAYEAWAPKHYETYKQAAYNLGAAYKHCTPLENMRMIDIRLKHLQDIMDSIKEKSVSSQTNLKTVFLKTFKYAMENDIVTKDYSQFVSINHTAPKKDIKDKFFTTAEIEAVIANKDWCISFPQARKKFADIQLVDSVIIMLYTGVRIGELLAIKTADVDISLRVIHLHGTKTDAAERKVPIHKELIPYLEKRIAEGNEYLLSNANGAPFIHTSYRKYFFEPFMKHIGSTHTPHALRHTFISIMDNCGVSSQSVVLKRIVGHSNKDVTEHYTHKDIAQLIKAIDKFKLPTSCDEIVTDNVI